MNKLPLPDLSGVNRGLQILLIEHQLCHARRALDILEIDRRVDAIDHVRDVDSALTLVRSGVAYDLVLAELYLPDRSGVEFIEAFRAHENSTLSPKYGRVDHVPVVMLTASDRAADFYAASVAGANCFVTKPRTFERLRDVLRRILRSMIWEDELPTLIAMEAEEEEARCDPRGVWGWLRAYG